MKILVIDDDRAAGRLIEQVLGERGNEVIVTHDPRAGYETAKAIVPDLIFLNLLLPGANGLKVSKAIHSLEALKNVPVMMFVSTKGELDARYTRTIGIVDTLVKPLQEEEIIAKTRAVLGDAAVPEISETTIRELPVENEIEPFLVQEEEELIEESALVSVPEGFDEPQKADYRSKKKEAVEPFTGLAKEEEADMPEKKDPADKKEEAFDDKDLFSEDTDVFGEELKKSLEEVQQEPSGELHEEADMVGDEVDLSYEEKPAGPFKRIMIIGASVVIGIVLGIGGYFFFTAGNKQTPNQKQVTKVLPEPAPVTPAPPSEKPNAVPEIAVKQEPQRPEPINPEQMKAGSVQTKDAKLQEPAKKDAVKEPAQKAEPEKPQQVPAPASAAKAEEKKITPQKQIPAKASASAKPKRTYYVQAGLFENEANANALAEKIRQHGHAASVARVEIPEKKTLYRVTAGSFTSFNKAVALSDTLNKKGIKAIVHKQ